MVESKLVNLNLTPSQAYDGDGEIDLTGNDAVTAVLLEFGLPSMLHSVPEENYSLDADAKTWIIFPARAFDQIVLEAGIESLIDQDTSYNLVINVSDI